MFSFNVTLELSTNPPLVVSTPVAALNENLVLDTLAAVKFPVVNVVIAGYNVVVVVSSVMAAPAAAQLNTPLPLLTKANPAVAASAAGNVQVTLAAIVAGATNPT